MQMNITSFSLVSSAQSQEYDWTGDKEKSLVDQMSAITVSSQMIMNLDEKCLSVIKAGVVLNIRPR